MNNPLIYDLYNRFYRLGCTTVRFNFRGVGRSQGSFDNGAGELSDAAAVLDWMATLYPNPSFAGSPAYHLERGSECSSLCAGRK